MKNRFGHLISPLKYATAYMNKHLWFTGKGFTAAVKRYYIL